MTRVNVKSKAIEWIFPEADSESEEEHSRLFSVAMSVTQHEHFTDAD